MFSIEGSRSKYMSSVCWNEKYSKHFVKKDSPQHSIPESAYNSTKVLATERGCKSIHTPQQTIILFPPHGGRSTNVHAAYNSAAERFPGSTWKLRTREIVISCVLQQCFDECMSPGIYPNTAAPNFLRTL